MCINFLAFLFIFVMTAECVIKAAVLSILLHINTEICYRKVLFKKP